MCFYIREEGRGRAEGGKEGAREALLKSYYRMCSLAIECVLFRAEGGKEGAREALLKSYVFSCYRMCSLATECVLLL